MPEIFSRHSIKKKVQKQEVGEEAKQLIILPQVVSSQPYPFGTIVLLFQISG